MYVVDARLLPPDCRILTTHTPRLDLGFTIGYLHGLRSCLELWLERLAQRAGASTFHLPEFSRDPQWFARKDSERNGPRLWLDSLSRSTLISDPRGLSRPFSVSKRLVERLHDIQARWDHPLTEVLPSQEALEDDFYAPPVHRFQNAVLYVLDRYGSLDVGYDQVAEALRDIGKAWLDTFSVPFDLSSMATQRTLASQQYSAYWQDNGEPSCSIANGVIVVVPGAIPVLSGRFVGEEPKGARRPS